MIQRILQHMMHGFWYWFLTGHRRGDRRYRYFEDELGSFWMWRDEEGREHVALPSLSEFALLLAIVGTIFTIIGLVSGRTH